MSLELYLLIGFIFAVPAAWVHVRWLWKDNHDDPVFLIAMAGVALVVVTLAYWVLVGVSVLCSLLWLFVQSAKPGRIKLPSRRRDRMQQRIDDLEAELGMRDG